MTPYFSFVCRTKTSAGINALEHLPFELNGMGARKPMVIRDAASDGHNCHHHLIRAFRDSGMTLGLAPVVPESDKDRPEEPARFIRSMYAAYREKGYDAVIALGCGRAADTAKALNVAAALGPEALKSGRITAPLNPMVYIPTGAGTGTATTATLSFNRNVLAAPFLAPDLALIDPVVLVPDERDTLLDTALFCLALGCEVHALSDNPPARAYAATLVALSAGPLSEMIAGYSERRLKKRKAAEAAWQIRLVQAAVISGYLAGGRQSLVTLALGRETVGSNGRLSVGMAMALILPAVLEALGNDDFGGLLLSLAGPDQFSAVPGPQRSAASVQALRQLLNDLHAVTAGRTPRTLGEAGRDPGLLTAAVTEKQRLPDISPDTLKTILAHACDGSPVPRLPV